MKHNDAVWKAAIVSQQQNMVVILNKLKTQTIDVMKEWGCDSDCSYFNTTNALRFNVGEAIDHCNCPAAVSVKFTPSSYVSKLRESMTDSEIDSALQGEEELIAITDSDSSSKNVSTDATTMGAIKTVFKLDTYTTTIMSIFGCQLIFCIAICCWTSLQVNKVKNESVRQQAEFYQFLYQFHKQMADEEAAIH